LPPPKGLGVATQNQTQPIRYINFDNIPSKYYPTQIATDELFGLEQVEELPALTEWLVLAV